MANTSFTENKADSYGLGLYIDNNKFTKKMTLNIQNISLSNNRLSSLGSYIDIKNIKHRCENCVLNNISIHNHFEPKKII